MNKNPPLPQGTGSLNHILVKLHIREDITAVVVGSNEGTVCFTEKITELRILRKTVAHKFGDKSQWVEKGAFKARRVAGT